MKIAHVHKRNCFFVEAPVFLWYIFALFPIQKRCSYRFCNIIMRRLIWVRIGSYWSHTLLWNPKKTAFLSFKMGKRAFPTLSGAPLGDRKKGWGWREGELEGRRALATGRFFPSWQWSWVQSRNSLQWLPFGPHQELLQLQSCRVAILVLLSRRSPFPTFVRWICMS